MYSKIILFARALYFLILFTFVQPIYADIPGCREGQEINNGWVARWSEFSAYVFAPSKGEVRGKRVKSYFKVLNKNTSFSPDFREDIADRDYLRMKIDKSDEKLTMEFVTIPTLFEIDTVRYSVPSVEWKIKSKLFDDDIILITNLNTGTVTTAKMKIIYRRGDVQLTLPITKVYYWKDRGYARTYHSLDKEFLLKYFSPSSDLLWIDYVIEHDGDQFQKKIVSRSYDLNGMLPSFNIVLKLHRIEADKFKSKQCEYIDDIGFEF